jgi:uncharacterized protein
MDSLFDSLAELAPAALVALAGLALVRFRGAGLVVLVGLLFLADAVLLRITDYAPAMNMIDSSWNWEGKIAALLAAVAVFACLPREMRTLVGLGRLPQARTWLWLAPMLGLHLALMAARTYYFGEPVACSLDTLAYQASLPGLHEEITYRGVWWVLLAAALDRDRIADGRMPWWTLAVTSILFGAVHAVDYTAAGGLSVELPALLATSVSGLLFGLMQGIGRSLWVPILAHNAGNLIVHGWQMGLPQPG